MKQKVRTGTHRFAGNSPATLVEVAGPESLVGMLTPQGSRAHEAGGGPDTAALLVAVERLAS
ncbi:hypothetical protein ACX80O_03980 [Arthrobacter sp. Hz1]